MNKYERVVEGLLNGQKPVMKVFGSSMMPLIKSGSKLTFVKDINYKIGDVVLSKVKGRWIDAHKITKIDGDRYLISNNHGWDNGWTRKIYGRVIAVNGKSFGRPLKD